MRVSWFWLLVVAACTEHGRSPTDAVPEVPTNPNAELAADQSSMDFGSIGVSSSSPQFVVQISNAGSRSTGSISAAVSESEFTVANGCTVLAPGGSCVMAVRFSPTTTGTKTSTLTVSSTPGGTIQIRLIGVATSI